MTDSIPVRQEDRETAAAISHMGSVTKAQIREGSYDNLPIVQAFARHAEQARIEERERCARIADERAAMRAALFNENGASINAAKAVEAEEIAVAIRNGEQANG
jgi:hypothetical protein